MKCNRRVGLFHNTKKFSNSTHVGINLWSMKIQKIFRITSVLCVGLVDFFDIDLILFGFKLRLIQKKVIVVNPDKELRLI